MIHNRFITAPYFLDASVHELAGVTTNVIQVAPELDPSATREQRLHQLYRAISHATQDALRDGERPVVFLGDCVAAHGVWGGLHACGIDPYVVWEDAHGDANNHATSPSGFLGGMSLALLAGLGDRQYLEAVGAPPVSGSRVLLTDARELDPGEVVHIRESGMEHVIDSATLIDRVWPAGPLWVHFDTDIITQDEMPATGFPTVGGPSADTVRELHRSLARTGRVVGVSCCWFPDGLDPDGKSRALCLDVLDALIGPA